MRVRTHDVIAFTADLHQMTVEEFLADKRTRPYVRARWVAILAIRSLCPHVSYPHIGKLMGGRDHTTILHGKREGDALYEVDDNFALAVEAVVAHFRDLQLDRAIDPARMTRALLDVRIHAAHAHLHALQQARSEEIRRAA